MREYDKSQALMLACFNGEMEYVQVLLDQGVNLEINSIAPGIISHYEWSPLGAAAYNGHTEIVQLLLDRGARSYGWHGGAISKSMCVESLQIRSNETNNAYILQCARLIEEQGRSTNNPCYIATACYGSYESPEVIAFRKFRDEVLFKTYGGRILIRLYYLLSPPIAHKLRNHRKVNAFVKNQILNRILNFIKS